MGHPPALLLPADGGEVQLVDSESDVLGSYPDALFQEKEFKVAKGDRLY
jgi:serine phosphatase RsbU (regulator of sigma subunit)